MLAEETTELYEQARARLARFVGAPDPSTIVFTRGTTESTNLIAYAWARKFRLREGDEICCPRWSIHSNIVPWQLAAGDTGAVLRYLPITDDGLLDLSDLGVGPDREDKLLAITGMSNSLGTLPPSESSPTRRTRSGRSSWSTARSSCRTSRST